MCLKKSFCKVPGCKVKYYTYLHLRNESQENRRYPGNDCHRHADNASVAEDGNKRTNANIRNSYNNTDGSQGSFNGTGPSVPSLVIVTVKLKARGYDKKIKTYAFLDGGSNTTFCTNQLMKQFGLKGKKTALSLITMEREQQIREHSRLAWTFATWTRTTSLNHPQCSTAQLPISKENIPSQ